MTRADNDGNVLFAVGGVSSTDSAATFSLSSASMETEPHPRKLAIAMSAREVIRADSAPQRRQASPLPGHWSSGNKFRALPVPPTAKVRQNSGRSGNQADSSESSNKADRSRSNEKAERKETRRAKKKAIEDSPRDRKLPVIKPMEIKATMEIEDVRPKVEGGGHRRASSGGIPVTGASVIGTTPRRMASPAHDMPRPTVLGPPSAMRTDTGMSDPIFLPIEERRDYFKSLPVSSAHSFASADSHGDNVPYDKAMEIQASSIEQITQVVMAREREASMAVANANAHVTAVHQAATAAVDEAKLAETQAQQDAYLTRDQAYKACDYGTRTINDLRNEKPKK